MCSTLAHAHLRSGRHAHTKKNSALPKSTDWVYKIVRCRATCNLHCFHYALSLGYSRLRAITARLGSPHIILKRASESAQQKEKTSSGSSGSPQTRPCMSLVDYANWGEPERDPHDAVYGDFVCLSVCTYVHIPYILVF